MSDRAEKRAAFLAGTHWADWQQAPLAGDASSRQYVRLNSGTQSVILMDAGADHFASTTAFANLADWLRDQSLAAPIIHKSDPKQGLLLLEDLGPTHIAAHVRAYPSDQKAAYAAATDVLVRLNTLPPPDDLTVMSPQVGGGMLDVTLDWYANHPRDADLPHAMTQALGDLCGAPKHVALRDYHAENLIWRPERQGLDQVGLLDFQDAFIAPRGYDLISLLRDVRRVVDPAICAVMTDRFERGTGLLTDGAFACLTVQRNLRILGVFARLARRDGKHRYMQMIPHLWSMIAQDLRHPALHELAKTVHATLPPPDKSAIKDLL